MLLFRDKEVEEIIKYLKDKIRKNKATSEKDHSLSAPRFVFVCGKEFVKGKETIRDIIINNLEKSNIENDYNKKNSSVLCVVSENLYVQDLAEDILSFEKMLAEISQRIIIVAESPGTFCELGAFSMDEDCLGKVTVINEDDEKYRNSFITKGPVKMIENRDETRVILHNGEDRIKKSEEFLVRMNDIANEDIEILINKKFDELNLRSLIYEFANLVEIFQPIEFEELQEVYKEIKGFEGNYKIKNTDNHKIKTFKKVVKLMESMDVVKNKKGLIILNPNISCYNIISNITRKEFNILRIQYLNRMKKYDPERLNVKWE